MQKALNRILPFLLILLLTFSPVLAEDEAVDMSNAGLFRPVDCGLPAQEEYEFPFIGLNLQLPAGLLSLMDSRDVFVYPFEDYADETHIAYAMLRFSAPTQAEKEEERYSVDIFAWEEAMAKIGVIGVYQAGMADQLDALTLCDRHSKVGESADGAYEYYLSVHSGGNAELAALLEQAVLDIVPMHELDLYLGYSAFAADRIDGVSAVGQFTASGIDGRDYTEAVFEAYDLTLVNLFATWCGPCVEEIPVLEQVRQACAEKGIRLGIVAVVMNAKTADGVDEYVLADAKALAESSGAGFPFLIPDGSDMNGRLTGISAFPESFFVDGAGNIVSDPYIGANDLTGWMEIVSQELDKLGF